MRNLLLLALAALAFVLVSCWKPTDPTSLDNTVHQSLSLGVTPSSDGTNQWVSSPTADLAKVRTVDLKLSLPTTGKRVFYLFTNLSANASNTISLAGVDASLSPREVDSSDEGLPRPHRKTRLEYPRWTPDLPVGRSASRAAGDGVSIPVYTPPLVGAATIFKDADLKSSAPIDTPTHLRFQRTVAGRTLNLWVADDSWDAAGDGELDLTNPNLAVVPPATTVPWTKPGHLVTLAMVTALADQFLKDGTNDVYGWVTGLVGAEWSSAGPPATNLIDGHGEVHIFIKNLNPGDTSNGVLMGYFSSLNNWVANVDWNSQRSNEKILFALDADSLANPDDDGDAQTTTDASVWALSDYWPAAMVSTLAHEFQHMVHFYQKQVRHNVGQTQTWLNEMASLVTEDLVADKLGNPGPRGRVELDVGDRYLSNGQFPVYNGYHDRVALTAWPTFTSGESPLPNYAQAYAFGAWLVRNYGGPALLKAIVQSPRLDTQAVVDAVNTVNKDVVGFTTQTYATLVRDWGLATFLQGNQNVDGLRYRSGTGQGAFTWTTESLSYQAGAIHLGAYYQVVWDATGTPRLGAAGPRLHTGGFAKTDSVAAGATFFFDAGVRTKTFRDSPVLPPNIQLTVVTVP